MPRWASTRYATTWLGPPTSNYVPPSMLTSKANKHRMERELVWDGACSHDTQSAQPEDLASSLSHLLKYKASQLVNHSKPPDFPFSHRDVALLMQLLFNMEWFVIRNTAVMSVYTLGWCYLWRMRWQCHGKSLTLSKTIKFNLALYPKRGSARDVLDELMNWASKRHHNFSPTCGPTKLALPDKPAISGSSRSLKLADIVLGYSLRGCRHDRKDKEDIWNISCYWLNALLI